jgi:cytochrome c553
VSTVTQVVVSWESGGPHGAGDSAGCLTRSCHLSNPHGVGGSQYVIVAAKLLDPAADDALAAAVSNEASSGIGLADLNAEVLPAEGGWSEATRSAVRTGYTCNQAGCHVQTMLTVLEAGWSEERFTSGDSGLTAEKTGHVTTGTPDGSVSFVPVASCVSCHDQTDSATAGVGYSTVSGYTFPHSQTPAGESNTGTGSRAWLWMTIASDAAGLDAGYVDSESAKAKDGACLKCHRLGDSGIGLDR